VEYLFPYAWPARELAQRLHDCGVQQAIFNAPCGGSDVQGINAAWEASERGTASIPGREAEFRAGIGWALEYAQALSCAQVHVMAGRVQATCMQPDGTSEQQDETYISNLRWAAERAAALGVGLLIEPINTRDMPGYYLHHQHQAHALLDRVNMPNVKVQMDLYHCQIMEGDLAERLAHYLPTGRVGHIQIAGVPTRHEPDVGEVNYPYLFERIDALGYCGWVGCEYRPAVGTSPGATTQGLSWLHSLR
jgi:hydroxypyruvate isomerase